MELKIKAAGRTDVGLVRPGNEDYLFLDPANKLFAVCDGMGGHKAGEVASMLAAETLQTAFNSFSKQLHNAPELNLGRTLPESGEILLKAIRIANRAIYSGAMTDESKAGMGTTVVAVAFEGDIMSIAHVGDSRAYRLDENQLTPLTTDHSWLEELQKTEGVTRREANSFVGKNVITRALGVKEDVDIDFRITKVKPGETFILCSDGLCGFVDDDEMFDTANDHREDLDEMIAQLIQMANDRGGSDNVTVIALQIESVKQSPLPEVGVFTLVGAKNGVDSALDSWVVRFAEHRHKSDQGVVEQGAQTKGSKPPGIGLWFLFATFAVIAIVIIYFAMTSK